MRAKIVTLEKVCDRGSSNLRQKDLENLMGDYPVYGASGYLKDIDFYHQEKECVAVIKDGAGIGRTMLLPKKSSVIGTLQYLIPKDNINAKYLYYAVKHMKLAKHYIGATIPHIYFKDYKNESLPLPSDDKQLEIVSILGKVEKIIENRKKQLEEFDDLIKSRFVEMFGDPQLNPMKWEVKNYSDLCDMITDGEHSTPQRCEEGIYLLSARNVLNHKLRLDDVDFIGDAEYRRISKRVVPRKGDILVSCSGSVGRVCTVPEGLKFQMVRSVALLRLKEDIKSTFMEYLISSDYTQRQIDKSKTQSSQANLFQGKIKQLKAIVPPIDLQDEFELFVQQVDKLKVKVQKSLDETQILFDSLMQQYFE